MGKILKNVFSLNMLHSKFMASINFTYLLISNANNYTCKIWIPTKFAQHGHKVATYVFAILIKNACSEIMVYSLTSIDRISAI